MLTIREPRNQVGGEFGLNAERIRQSRLVATGCRATRGLRVEAGEQFGGMM